MTVVKFAGHSIGEHWQPIKSSELSKILHYVQSQNIHVDTVLNVVRKHF